MNNNKGYITEIFSSYQGEGLYVGQKQTFVRFTGCNLVCTYCDTKTSQNTNEGVEMSVSRIVEECLTLRCKVISLTGGEPLNQSGFLLDVIQRLKANKFIIYLETNGTLFDELKTVINYLDIVAMDIKLPSLIRKSYTNMQIVKHWKAHQQFLDIARDKDVFVKVVVSNDTSIDEFSQCVDIIRTTDKNIPLIIQPVTAKESVKAEKLDELFDIASAIINNVRIIPQCHKMLGIR